MPAKNSQKTRANIELILLGFLVSLILKGLLDHVYSTQLERAKSWREVMGIVQAAHPMEVFVFLFALLRFMYGVYRFHELGPDNASPGRVLYDLIFTVLLFIGFYLASVLIKYQPIQFYELFAVTHAIDLIWFLPFIKRPSHLFIAGGDFCEEAARRFVALDILTLAAMGIFFWCSGLFASISTPVYPLYILGWSLIMIGGIDLWWNAKFYFHKIG